MSRFVDANVFIYVLASDPTHGPTSRGILTRIENGEAAATSTLVLSQVCAYLAGKRREDAVPTFLDYLRNLHSLTKEPTLFEDLAAGADLGRKLRLPQGLWDDLAIAAQMERLGIKEIYSADRDFDRIPGVRRVF